jgi:hypothetical protein
VGHPANRAALRSTSRVQPHPIRFSREILLSTPLRPAARAAGRISVILESKQSPNIPDRLPRRLQEIREAMGLSNVHLGSWARNQPGIHRQDQRSPFCLTMGEPSDYQPRKRRLYGLGAVIQIRYWVA